MRFPTHRRFRYRGAGMRSYVAHTGKIVLVTGLVDEGGNGQESLYNIVDPVDGWRGKAWTRELERITS